MASYSARWLATRHYENFHVVSFLLPKRLHQDFYNVYAYCRWSDDLADETGNRDESLRLLDQLFFQTSAHRFAQTEDRAIGDDIVYFEAFLTSFENASRGQRLQMA